MIYDRLKNFTLGRSLALLGLILIAAAATAAEDDAAQDQQKARRYVKPIIHRRANQKPQASTNVFSALEQDIITRQVVFAAHGRIDPQSYVQFLKRMHRLLAQHGIKSTLHQNFPITSDGPSATTPWLQIDPATRKNDPWPNQLAKILARYHYTLRYLSVRQLALRSNSTSSLTVNDVAHYWYISARALENKHFLKTYIVQNNLDILENKYLPPLAKDVLQNVIFYYYNNSKLPAVTSDAIFPNTAIILNEAAGFFVPRNSPASTGINPELNYRLISHHRADQKIAYLAAHLQQLLAKQKPIYPAAKERLQRNFVFIKNGLLWHIVNMNAAIYTMLQNPANVDFYQPSSWNRLKLHIYPDPQVHFDYNLDLLWAGPAPAAEDMRPVLVSPAFQIFVRYYLDAYRKYSENTKAIINITALQDHELQTLLENLATFDQRPQRINQEVDEEIWEADRLFTELQAVQKEIIEDLRHPFVPPSAAQAYDCATNFLSPENDE